MKNKIMQLAAAAFIGAFLIVASCTSSTSEKAGDQDTTATPVDTTAIDTTAADTTKQDTSSVQ